MDSVGQSDLPPPISHFPTLCQVAHHGLGVGPTLPHLPHTFPHTSPPQTAPTVSSIFAFRSMILSASERLSLTNASNSWLNLDLISVTWGGQRAHGRYRQLRTEGPTGGNCSNQTEATTPTDPPDACRSGSGPPYATSPRVPPLLTVPSRHALASRGRHGPPASPTVPTR